MVMITGPLDLIDKQFGGGGGTGVPLRCSRVSRSSAPDTGVIKMPCTRCSSSSSRQADSFAC